MNSELGMLLPFAFVMFAVWGGTRIILERTQARSAIPPDFQTRLDDLAARLDQPSKLLITAAEVSGHYA